MLIDSRERIRQLKEGDIILRPAKNENYLIDAIGEDFLLLSDFKAPRTVRIIYFSNLIKEKWQAQTTALRQNDFG
ncbi:MAG TPA: hypothetical protein VIH86_13155 [Puia sp.]|jgi:hypothetical protein